MTGTPRLAHSVSGPSVDFYISADPYGTPNIDNNTSVVRTYIYAINRGNTSTYNGSGGQAIGRITNAQTNSGWYGPTGSSMNFGPGYGNGSTFWEYGPYDITVTHNADGTGSAALEFDVGLGSYDSRVSTTLTLPTIPRATIPAVTPSSRELGQTFTISLPRASTSFTHDLTYSMGSLTGQTAGLSATTGVATSATLTPPASLAKQMVGATSRTLTIQVVTKNGATVIGTRTTEVTVTPAGGVVYQNPTLTASVRRATAGGVLNDEGTYAKVAIDAAVSSVFVGVEQNKLTYKIEVSPDGTTWQNLANTVTAGLTLAGWTNNYADSNPGAGGTQPFLTTSSYRIRVTITDQFGLSATQTLVMTTALAVLDLFDDGTTRAASIGAVYDTVVGGALQAFGERALMQGDGYLPRQVVKFTSNGTFSKASYPWLRAIRARVQAGGGGGGSSAAAGGSYQSFGQGGGGGGYAESFITDIAGLAASVTVTVGAGGAANGAGGASSFGALVAASGGAGGGTKPNSPYTAYVPGGAGGIGTAGDILVGGGGGGSGAGDAYGLCASGAGGGSALGGGGNTVGTGGGAASLAGMSGRNFGGGGGGATTNGSGSAATGGAGAPGIVILELFG